MTRKDSVIHLGVDDDDDDYFDYSMKYRIIVKQQSYKKQKSFISIECDLIWFDCRETRVFGLPRCDRHNFFLRYKNLSSLI